MAGNLPSSQPDSSIPQPEDPPSASQDIPEEALQYRQQYLDPILHSPLLQINFGPGEMDGLAGIPLIFAFEDLTGGEQMKVYWDTYQADFPRELVEDCLTAHFDVTPDQLREQLLTDYYLPDKQAYHYEGGRGSGPREIEATASRRDGDTLELDYTILNLSMDEDEMIPYLTGTITIRIEGESWKYISNQCQEVQ